MNPLDPRHPWQRLAAAARQAPNDRDSSAPYGFGARVSALAFSGEQASSLFARFSLRALGLACLLMLGTVATNYASVAKIFSEDDAAWSDDPVAELVEIAS